MFELVFHSIFKSGKGTQVEWPLTPSKFYYLLLSWLSLFLLIFNFPFENILKGGSFKNVALMSLYLC